MKSSPSSKALKTLVFFLALLSGALLSAVVFLWMAAGEIYDYQDTFDLKADANEVEVVLCLAGGKGRIPIAVELWEKIKHEQEPKKELVLFLSGVGPSAGLETLREQGVPKESLEKISSSNVIFENVSENTFENAQLFMSFARQKQWRNVVLVTAGYHMRRAEFILRKVMGSPIRIKTFTVDTEHFDRNRWHQDPYAIRVTLIEYIKWLYYRYSY